MGVALGQSGSVETGLAVARRWCLAAGMSSPSHFEHPRTGAVLIDSFPLHLRTVASGVYRVEETTTRLLRVCLHLLQSPIRGRILTYYADAGTLTSTCIALLGVTTGASLLLS